MPLSDDVRARVEPLLGADLTGVRIHDAPADRDLAAKLGARAFTVGEHIWLGPRGSRADTSLLAHEAAHVVQQRYSMPMVQRAPDERTPREAACEDIIRDDPETSDLVTGRVVHDAIQDWFYQRFGRPDPLNLRIAGASSAALREGKYVLSGDPGFPDLWHRVGPTTLQLGEIKPANKEGYALGVYQLDHYLEKAKADLALQREFGVTSFEPMNPWLFWVDEPVLVMGHPYLVLWCQPGLLLYKRVKLREEDEDTRVRPPLFKKPEAAEEKKKEKKREREYTAVRRSSRPVITQFEPEIRAILPQVEDALVKHFSPTAGESEYLIVAPWNYFEAAVLAPKDQRFVDRYQPRNPRLDPRSNPVAGFRNLGLTLCLIFLLKDVELVLVGPAAFEIMGGLAAGAEATVGVGESAAVLSEAAAIPEAAAVPAAAATPAAAEGAAVPAWMISALQSEAARSGVRLSGALLAVVVARKASASTGEVESSDAIRALPASGVVARRADEPINLMTEVLYDGRKYYVIGRASYIPETVR